MDCEKKYHPSHKLLLCINLSCNGWIVGDEKLAQICQFVLRVRGAASKQNSQIALTPQKLDVVFMRWDRGY